LPKIATMAPERAITSDLRNPGDALCACGQDMMNQ
jgi:hypothetical protein